MPTHTKPPPTAGGIPGQFFYAPSDDGTDENLLVLLHGLGDTHLPFSKLGKNIKLPQTAIFSLRAPEPVPFLYEEAYQWYPSFDQLGEILKSPNPTTAFRYLEKVVDHLTRDCQWPINRIHFFGFAQGGSVASEFVLERWKTHLLSEQSSSKITSNNVEDQIRPASSSSQSFASVVSISGPLLSYPTQISERCPTPLFVAHGAVSSPVSEFKNGFSSVTEFKMGKESMPSSIAEWEPIMRFWSERLARRPIEGFYEVTGRPM